MIWSIFRVRRYGGSCFIVDHQTSLEYQLQIFIVYEKVIVESSSVTPAFPSLFFQDPSLRTHCRYLMVHCGAVGGVCPSLGIGYTQVDARRGSWWRATSSSDVAPVNGRRSDSNVKILVQLATVVRSITTPREKVNPEV
jgi:hypothetical protein